MAQKPSEMSDSNFHDSSILVPVPSIQVQRKDRSNLRGAGKLASWFRHQSRDLSVASTIERPPPLLATTALGPPPCGIKSTCLGNFSADMALGFPVFTANLILAQIPETNRSDAHRSLPTLSTCHPTERYRFKSWDTKNKRMEELKYLKRSCRSDWGKGLAMTAAAPGGYVPMDCLTHP